MDKRKAKVRGIIAAFCMIAAAFGLRAVKSAVFAPKHPKNEFSVSVEDTYTRYVDYTEDGKQKTKAVLVVKYELYNGTDEDCTYIAFRDYAMQNDKECTRHTSEIGLPTEKTSSIKPIKPGETASFFVEYDISSKKGDISLCVDRNFVKSEKREYLRMTLDPNTGKEI